MTNMSKKYAALGDYLDAQTDNEIDLSFEQIEEILRGCLPESASIYDAWWSNSPVAGRHNDVWLSRGWETAGLNRNARTVRFARSPSPRTKTANPKPRALTVPPPSSPPLEAAPVAASNNVMLSFEWKVLGEITLDIEGGLLFPAVTLGAGLYRIRIVLDGRSRFYVGESQSLRRRFGNYRAGPPGQKTSYRIHHLLKDALAEGAQIAVDIVIDGVALTINGAGISPNLADKATRRMIEHAAIVATGGTDVELANK